MLLIECPWCGSRAETEFSCGGEADISRPESPALLSDADWADIFSCARIRAAGIGNFGTIVRGVASGLWWKETP